MTVGRCGRPFRLIILYRRSAIQIFAIQVHVLSHFQGPVFLLGQSEWLDHSILSLDSPLSVAFADDIIVALAFSFTSATYPQNIKLHPPV